MTSLLESLLKVLAGLLLTRLSSTLYFGWKFLILAIGRLDDKQGEKDDSCLP